MQGNTVSVERVIKAPPSEIFALLADAAKHSAIDGSGSVLGVPPALRGGGTAESNESLPLSKGSKFGMSMRWGLPYRTTNTVVEFEPDKRIAWQTTMLGGLVGGRIWRYELSPADGGTLVRETWDISRDRQRPVIRMTMAKQAEDGMRATLERIAGLLEKSE